MAPHPTGEPVITYKCVKCNRGNFKTHQALAAHQAALGHYLSCSECHEEFKTWTALNKHKRVHKQNNPPHLKTGVLGLAPARTPVLTGTAAPGGPFSKVLDKIVVPKEEYSLLYDKLLAACHSSPRLQLQAYRLTTAPPEKKPRKEKPVRENATGEKPSTENPPKDISSKEKLAAEKRRQTKGVPFLETPKSLPGQQYKKRKAIALDCEMVGVGVHYDDELAFLSAVDFFTGEVLIHSYVKPTQKVTQWRSRYSGVTPAAMNAAVAAGQALPGGDSARQALWQHADKETILIGHSLNSDLKVLRIVHLKIVDSAILTSEHVFNPELGMPLKRTWALKMVAKELLNRDIQMGRKGHDCLEDTLATRDVVICCLLNPDRLTVWVQKARTEHELRMEHLKQEREAREQEKKENEEKEKEKLQLSEQKKLTEHPQDVLPGPDMLDLLAGL